MDKNKFNSLLKEYGPEALAESLVFPAEAGQQSEPKNEALKKILDSRRAIKTEKEKTELRILQLAYQIEDYLNNNRFDKNKTFGAFLKTYVLVLKIKMNEFASEIDVKPSELSQYVNNHRKPPKNIMIRLELHSGKKIPAVNWYRLAEKKTLHELTTDKSLRTLERKHVKKLPVTF